MKDISYKDFSDMEDDNKWQYVWNVLTNHFHQIREMKWWLRGVGLSLAAYFAKLIFF